MCQEESFREGLEYSAPEYGRVSTFGFADATIEKSIAEDTFSMRITWILLILCLLAPTLAEAALVNVTNANYIVTSVDVAKRAFGVDLVQNGARNTRTEIRINRDAKCYWVNHDGSPDTPLTIDQFVRRVHKGTKVRVNGGRAWDNKVNASDLWAE
jgi:hypothetical protein